MGISENLIPIIGTLAGAVLGVGGTVFAAWLSSGRTHKEKVWDLRRQAYGVILSEIATVERIVRNAEEMMAEDTHRYFESKEPPLTMEKSHNIGRGLRNALRMTTWFCRMNLSLYLSSWNRMPMRMIQMKSGLRSTSALLPQSRKRDRFSRRKRAAR
jgi:hypothetical protein